MLNDQILRLISAATRSTCIFSLWASRHLCVYKAAAATLAVSSVFPPLLPLFFKREPPAYLEVSVYDALGVHCLKGQENPAHRVSRLILRKGALFTQVVEQLPAL